MWSLWPELVSDESFATGSVWLYFGLSISVFCTWILGCLPLADRFCGGFADALDDYGLEAPIFMAPPFLVMGLLYMYRSGIPGYEDDSTPWSTVAHTGAGFYLALGVGATLMADGDSEGSVFWCVFISVLVFTSDAAALQTGWWLVALCVIFTGTFGGAGAAVGMVVNEDGGRGSTIWGFMCCLMIGMNIGMVYSYDASDYVLDNAAVFQITGAGNHSIVNGIYHLRVDLRDGVAAIEEITADECEKWYGCWFEDGDDRRRMEESGVDDGDCFVGTGENKRRCIVRTIVGISDQCLSDLSSRNQHIYQLQAYDVDPTAGLVLYKPVDTQMWVIAPAKPAFESCFKSQEGFLHSLHNVCARRPDNDACAGLWREADVSTPPAWRDAAKFQLEVPAGSTDDDDACLENMCCAVDCPPVAGKGEAEPDHLPVTRSSSVERTSAPAVASPRSGCSGLGLHVLF